MTKIYKTTAALLLLTAIPSVAYRFIESSTLLDRLDLLGYFTIQSNIFVILIVALSHAGLPLDRKIKMAAGAFITVTAIIYQLFLRQTWNPQGISAVVSNINHGSTTLLYLFWFWSEPERIHFGLKDIWAVIPYPAIYCLFGIYEAFTRDKPARYFFLNIPDTGWMTFGFWFIGLTILLIGSGFFIIFIYGRVGKLTDNKVKS